MDNIAKSKFDLDQLIRRLTSVAISNSQLSSCSGISLLPIFLSSDQIEVLTMQIAQLSRQLIEITISLRSQGLETLMKEFSLPSFYLSRLEADPTCPPLVFLRPDGIFFDQKFRIFEANFSSSAYGLFESLNTNTRFIEFLASIEVGIARWETIDTDRLFAKAISSAFPNLSQLRLLNARELDGRPCDTEIELLCKRMHDHLSIENEFIEELNLASPEGEIGYWKTYHSPDQVEKNLPFFSAWRALGKRKGSVVLDSIYEVILSNKYLLTLVDESLVGMKTESIFELQLNPGQLAAQRLYFKLGNSAAGTGNIRSKNIAESNWRRFLDRFLDRHTICQPDVTDNSLYPFIQLTSSGMKFGYAPIVISPVFCIDKIIGFYSHVLSPYGRLSVPTFIYG